MEKVIYGFEDYTINDSGINEMSVWSTKSHRWLTPRLMPNGYVQICFSKDGKHYYRYLHRLIAEAFLDKPSGCDEVDHVNSIRNDNHPSNLRWVDKNGNMGNPITRDRLRLYRTGRHLSEDSRRKLFKKVYQYTVNGELVRTWDSVVDTESGGFSRSNVSACCRGVLKTSKGYRWSYEPL